MAKIYGLAFAITPSNTLGLPQMITGLYVGVTGDVTVGLSDGTFATFTAVPAGAILPVQVKRVMSTGTTATFLVGLV